jgi:hypothetical protein
MLGVGKQRSSVADGSSLPQSSIPSFFRFQIPVTSRVDSGETLAGGNVAARVLGEDCTKSIVSSVWSAPLKGVTKRSSATSFDLASSVQEKIEEGAARIEPFLQSLRLNRFE